ncbi:MAG: TFIIB-type zinc ribbon-containing protein [Pyrobaculum sp.]
MNCPYCKSDKIVLIHGEYVCTNCGTVVGYEMVAPRTTYETPIRREKKIVLFLSKESKISIKKRYSELVKIYMEKICKEIKREDIAQEAFKLFTELDKRIWQGKNPRVVAAALVYLAAERRQLYLHKQKIAKILNISKYTIRDTVSKIRKYV